MSDALAIDSPTLPAGVRLGEVLAGRYRLDRILGAGGMGVVVSAMHMQLDQRIAIKFMSPLLMANDVGVQRFMLEARNAARIQCEHVVRVFDVAALDDGSPYIVMEHLEGEDLQRLLERVGRLSIADAVDYVLQAGEAIAEAHLAGVVHRDLKPGNLFCCKRADGSPLVKVLDFGISKLLPRADMTARPGVSTGPYPLMGSPLYASPEQLGAPADVDARADIWGLGAILYELLAGKPAFSGATFLEICASVMRDTLPPLSRVRPDVSTELVAVIARALAKDPGMRFQTVGELATALSPWAPRRALVSVERIGNLYRGGPQPSSDPSALPSHARGGPGDKTLPSRPDPPMAAHARRRTRLSVLVRSPAGLALVAGSVVALALLLAAGIVVPWRPAQRAVEAPSAPTAWAPSPALSPPTTLAPPPEPAAAPPGATAEAPHASAAGNAREPSAGRPTAPPSPPRPPATLGSGAKPPASAGRVPDTSGFGGLL